MFSLVPLLFFSRFVLFCFGSELVRLELVAVMKLLFAAFNIGVGSALNIRWLVGMALVGGSGVWALAPNTLICEGGIQGARRCIRPRMCWGMRSAVARAYIAPAECARIENFVILRDWQIAYTSSMAHRVSRL